MIYLFTFIICIISDKYFNKTKYRYIYYATFIWLFVFLCFGYTTGSDWRNYELYYNGTLPLNALKEQEFGFSWLLKNSRYLISDFWLFNGIIKIVYLYTLLKFFSNFTDKKLTAVALSFCWYSLFMLIDCPMRYMIGTAMVLYATSYLIKKKWVYGILLLLAAISFHTMIILSALLALAIIFIGKHLTKVKTSVLVSIFVLCQIISTLPHYFDSILLTIGTNEYLSGYATSYAEYTTQSYQTIGSIKNIVFFIMFILSRKAICSIKNGEYLFNGTLIYFTLGSIFIVLPTGFRLAIFPGYFWVAAFTCIIYTVEYHTNIIKRSAKYILMLLLAYQVISTVYSTYIYYPYTNSIKYILTKHIPYNIRNVYNINEWNDEFRFQ